MIRPFVADDSPALIEILRLNTPEFFAPSEEEDYVNYLKQELEEYFVMEREGKLVGAGGINFFPGSRSARISWDLIHPDFQGKGFGSQLVQHRIQRLWQAPEVDTIVVRTSQLVHNFYAKAGFSLVKTQKDFWAPGFDLYQLEMSCK